MIAAMRIIAIAALSAVAVSCGGGETTTAECSELWIDGADVNGIQDSACMVDGEPTIFGWTSHECGDTEMRLNDLGWWLTSNMTLRTDFAATGGYTLDDLDAHLAANCG